MNIETVYKGMLELINNYSWGGACYASTAIMHAVLKLSGIDSKPCIGVVECINGEKFDHAWLEVNDKKYDVAIPYPLGNSTVSEFVEPCGFYGVSDTPNFAYGIDMDLDSEADFISQAFSNIMNACPFWGDGCDYWDVAEFFAKFFGIDVEKDDLVNALNDSIWYVQREIKA